MVVVVLYGLAVPNTAVTRADLDARVAASPINGVALNIAAESVFDSRCLPAARSVGRFVALPDWANPDALIAALDHLVELADCGIVTARALEDCPDGDCVAPILLLLAARLLLFLPTHALGVCVGVEHLCELVAERHELGGHTANALLLETRELALPVRSRVIAAHDSLDGAPRVHVHADARILFEQSNDLGRNLVELVVRVALDFFDGKQFGLLT